MFTSTNENRPTIQEDKDLEIEKFEKEIDDYMESLNSLGDPGVGRPPKNTTSEREALAGDTYHMNKVKGDPAGDLQTKQKGDPLFIDDMFDRDLIQPTPPAMLRERVETGGARSKAPRIPGFSTIHSPPNLLWGRGEGQITQFATPSAWSLGEGATGVDKTLLGMKAAFRPVREEEEVAFKTPQNSQGGRGAVERKYRAFVSADVPTSYLVPPSVRADRVERLASSTKFSPEISRGDYWVEDSLESRPKRVCKTPRSEVWVAREEAYRPAGEPVHSTELSRPAAARWSCEGLVEAQEADAIREPYVPPPVRLLRQEEKRGEALLNRMEKGTWPSNDRPDPNGGGET